MWEHIRKLNNKLHKIHRRCRWTANRLQHSGLSNNGSEECIGRVFHEETDPTKNYLHYGESGAICFNTHTWMHVNAHSTHVRLGWTGYLVRTYKPLISALWVSVKLLIITLLISYAVYLLIYLKISMYAQGRVFCSKGKFGAQRGVWVCRESLVFKGEVWHSCVSRL